MKHQMVSHLPDADMQAAPAALLRAAARAREIARQTQTGVVVVRNGVIVEDSATVTQSDDQKNLHLGQ
jgi:hypothetical protein